MNRLPLGQGVFVIPAPSPRTVVCNAFKEPLARWWTKGSSLLDPNRCGERDVREALAKLDDAIAALGKRDGARADAAREWLTSHRDRLATSLANFEAIGGHFRPKSHDQIPSGAIAEAFAVRIENARAAVANAEHALEYASPGDAAKAHAELESAEAAQREVGREFAELVAGVAFPKIPDLSAIDTAREQTETLTRRLAHNRQPATTLEIAIAQGRDASDDVARLWACWEPAPAKHQAWELRVARHVEAKS